MNSEERSNEQECPHCHRGVLRREASRTCPRCLASYVDDLPARLAAVERERERDALWVSLGEHQDAITRECNRLSGERDAALARIAAVEAKLQPSALFDALYDAMYGQISVSAEEREAVAQAAESLAASLAASPTPTGPGDEAWAVDLIDCGRDDGVQVCATWAEADAFRRSYIASAVGMQHCERTALIRHATTGTRLGYHDRAPYFPGPATPEPTEETP